MADLDSFVLAELEKFRNVLDISIEKKKPFNYLSNIANAYNVPKTLVFDEGLDLFNYYISRGARSDQALKWSLCKAHEIILRNYLS